MVLTTFICMHYRPQTGLPPPWDWDPDSLPGEAEFASGWPAALAGSPPWVSELPGNVWGVCGLRNARAMVCSRSASTCRTGCWGDPNSGRVSLPGRGGRPGGCPIHPEWSARASEDGNARAMVHSRCMRHAGEGGGGGDRCNLTQSTH